MNNYHLYFVFAGLSAALITAGFVLYRFRKHRFAERPPSPKRSTLDPVTSGASRTMTSNFCDTALETISKRAKEGGDPKESVKIALAMIDEATKTGRFDVLDEALTKVDPSWPPEVISAIWINTAPAKKHLPSRESMWLRYKAQRADKSVR